jgi:hypothetical protein
MKKLLILLFVSISILGYAQQFQLSDPKGNPYFDGHIFSETITVNDLNPTGAYEINIKITNLTAEEFQIFIKCTMIEMVEGMDVEACLGVCAIMFDSVINNNAIIEGGGNALYEFHLKPGDLFGMNKFVFEFMVGEEIVTLYANINMTPVGVAEFAQNASLSAYPNPASANAPVTISYTLTDNTDHHLVIKNILGAAIANIPLSPYENKVVLDASLLKSGVYFYAIENRNQISIAKKLIVK